MGTRQKVAILKICIYVFLIKTTNKMTLFYFTSIEKIHGKELIFPLILVRCC